MIETHMMKVRKAAFNTMARSHEEPPDAYRQVDPFVHLTTQDVNLIAQGSLPPTLVTQLVCLIGRPPRCPGLGYAVLTGLAPLGDLPRRRHFHRDLFSAVWDKLRQLYFPSSTADQYQCKQEVISDGQIEEQRFGTRWTFKEIHADREALLFSHVYGPTEGFRGGDLVLVDIRSYLAQTRQSFDELFHWSSETTPGSKPVIRPDWTRSVIEKAGFVLDSPNSDSIVFVNNMPEAGVLHGVGEITITQHTDFIRDYHRCSVKPSSGEAPIIDWAALLSVTEH